MNEILLFFFAKYFPVFLPRLSVVYRFFHLDFKNKSRDFLWRVRENLCHLKKFAFYVSAHLLKLKRCRSENEKENWGNISGKIALTFLIYALVTSRGMNHEASKNRQITNFHSAVIDFFRSFFAKKNIFLSRSTASSSQDFASLGEHVTEIWKIKLYLHLLCW